jgi:hypothetical protein
VRVEDLGAAIGKERQMTPTIFRDRGYRYFFFSREEPRMHVHVQSEEGEAKFWIEPEIALAVNHGLPEHELSTIQQTIEERIDEIREAWNRHFGP